MPTVLIVEDHDDFRITLAELLQRHGWKVLSASTLDEAWKAAHAEPVDVVLCDVLLRGVTGVAVKTRFATDSESAAVPFVFMTGYAPHIEELAPDRVLLKPLVMDVLHDALVAALSRPA